jgi:hypothetical protein
MKKPLILFFIFVISFVAMLPLIEGYLFKQLFFRMLPTWQHPNVTIEINAYKLGWLSSTIDKTVRVRFYKDENRFIEFHIQSIVDHGPFVFFDGHWIFARAKIQTTIRTPDVALQNITGLPDELIQSTNLISQDGRTWILHAATPIFSFSINWQNRWTKKPETTQFKWEGLVSDSTALIEDQRVIYIKNKIIVGKFSISDENSKVELEPTNASIEASKQDGVWQGAYSINNQQADIFYRNNNYLIKQISDNISYGINQGSYFYHNKLHIADITSPSFTTLNNLSNVNYNIEVNNLSIDGIKNLTEANKLNYATHSDRAIFQNLRGLLTATTNINLLLSLQTKLGDVSISSKHWLTGLPEDQIDIFNKINSSTTLTASHELTHYVIKSLLNLSASMKAGDDQAFGTNNLTIAGSQDNRLSDDVNELADNIVSQLIAKQYVVDDGKNYIAAIEKAAAAWTLNSMPINDAGSILNDIGKLFILKGKCYAKGNAASTDQWTESNISDQNHCYAMDSCLRGLGQSGIGCYKWSLSANSKPLPWNTDQQGSTNSAVTTTTSSQGYQCFWMENRSGKSVWVPFPAASRQACFEKDSCSGGLGLSSGGCYKWASAADEKGVPWDSATQSIAQAQPVTKPQASLNINVAFVVNHKNSTVSVCDTENNSTLSHCVSFASAGFVLPTNILLNDTGTEAYISGQLQVTCQVTPKGGLSACIEGESAASKFAPNTAVMPSTNQHSYSIMSNQVMICTLNTANNQSTCNKATIDVPFTMPTSITTNKENTYAYITTDKPDSIIICPIINSGSAFGPCSSFTDPTFSTPIKILIYSPK